MSVKATQCEKILAHMEKHDGITSMEAIDLYGITRLASRICDLRKSGHRIGRTFETRRNRDGEAVTFARYRLED